MNDRITEVDAFTELFFQAFLTLHVQLVIYMKAAVVSRIGGKLEVEKLRYLSLLQPSEVIRMDIKRNGSQAYCKGLGQTLIVIAGFGCVHREGEAVEEIWPGDVFWFSPAENHWRGTGGVSNGK